MKKHTTVSLWKDRTMILFSLPGTSIPSAAKTTGAKAGKGVERNRSQISKNSWLKSRLAVQTGFIILILWIGWEYVRFVDSIRIGSPVSITERPPGVEGFLPISSLMELWL